VSIDCGSSLRAFTIASIRAVSSPYRISPRRVRACRRWADLDRRQPEIRPRGRCLAAPCTATRTSNSPRIVRARSQAVPGAHADPDSDARAGDYLQRELRLHRFGALKPGEMLELPLGQKWVIEFDRGGGYGSARYGMTDGQYKFALTSNGWELYHKAT